MQPKESDKNTPNKDIKADNELVRRLAEEKYKYGFTTNVHTDIIDRGLTEDTVRLISRKKGEPDWLLEFRLKAYRHWLTMDMPTWAHLRIPEIDYQGISYYADPTAKKEGPKSMDEVDPELIKTFNKLGIPLEEQMALSGMAVDAVMDSVSVKTTFKETLMEKGIIFCSISEAVREHPDLVQRYLGSVVPYRDNFFAALNSAVFSDGSFVYIPKGVRCPMELSTYFRINAQNTGQFERTLIVADDDSYVSYLEGCTAPMRDENQLHAAIVEIVVHDRAEVKYSTVQNWYPGDAEGRGGVYNFVTKRGLCKGESSKLSWTQVETGSAITWKYPSTILAGDNSVGEFYSVAVTNHHQQADTGTTQHPQHHRQQGHLRRTERKLLPRPGARGPESRQCAELQPVRLPPAGQPLRRAHLPLHGHPQRDGHRGARSHHLQDKRRPAVLLQPARHRHRGRRGPHRQRLRQGGAQQAAHGVCRRGAKAALGVVGRKRGIAPGIRALIRIFAHNGRQRPGKSGTVSPAQQRPIATVLALQRYRRSVPSLPKPGNEQFAEAASIYT